MQPFAVTVGVPVTATCLTVATPNVAHQIAVGVRAARDGQMQPVLRVLGAGD